jgi:hypothetical protein
MIRTLRWITILVAAAGLAAVGDPAYAQGKGKDKERSEQKGGEQKGAAQKEKKAHHHHNGKSLLGDKIKQDGRHALHQHGKFAASVDVSKGKIAGVKVKHAEKGDVKVTKYKTNKKMAEAPGSGIQPVSLILAQQQYLGETWIGYSYIDDYGDEVIYWFLYDMVLDGDTGAIEYIPA